jgi:hypothetical protein
VNATASENHSQQDWMNCYCESFATSAGVARGVGGACSCAKHALTIARRNSGSLKEQDSGPTLEDTWATVLYLG